MINDYCCIFIGRIIDDGDPDKHSNSYKEPWDGEALDGLDGIDKRDSLLVI